MMWVTSTLRTLANEDIGTLAEYDPLTGYEPNDLHISETENRSLNLHDLDLDDLDLDDYTIARTLSSPLFTQERENAASRRRAYHSLDEGLSSSQSSSVGHGTGRRVGDQFDSLNQTSQKIRAAAQNMSKSGFFRNDKKSKFSLIVEQRFKTRIPGRL